MARLGNIASFDAAGAPSSGEELTEERVRQSAFEIIRNNVLCSMATVTDSGAAHVNTAYFCYSEELELYFLSHPSSLHCRNLAANSSMALAIYASVQNWSGPDKGLQLFGDCYAVPARDVSRAERLYGERFSAFTNWKANLTSTYPGQQYRFYLFVPDRLKLLDEERLGEAVFVCATIHRK